jgi:tRNA A37 N6-isopentenylltransferase MiaA
MGYTQEEYEQVKEMLLEHRGRDNQISSREINEVVELDNVGSFPQTRECVRDIMFEERIPIIGGGNGYYVAETEEEIADALETLESRILHQAERKMTLKRAAQQWEDVDPDDEHDIL